MPRRADGADQAGWGGLRRGRATCARSGGPAGCPAERTARTRLAGADCVGDGRCAPGRADRRVPVYGANGAVTKRIASGDLCALGRADWRGVLPSGRHGPGRLWRTASGTRCVRSGGPAGCLRADGAEQAGWCGLRRGDLCAPGRTDRWDAPRMACAECDAGDGLHQGRAMRARLDGPAGCLPRVRREPAARGGLRRARTMCILPGGPAGCLPRVRREQGRTRRIASGRAMCARSHGPGGCPSHGLRGVRRRRRAASGTSDARPIGRTGGMPAASTAQTGDTRRAASGTSDVHSAWRTGGMPAASTARTGLREAGCVGYERCAFCLADRRDARRVDGATGPHEAGCAGYERCAFCLADRRYARRVDGANGAVHGALRRGERCAPGRADRWGVPPNCGATRPVRRMRQVRAMCARSDEPAGSPPRGRRGGDEADASTRGERSAERA